jgi:hypothetical protein
MVEVEVEVEENFLSAQKYRLKIYFYSRNLHLRDILKTL